jgi:hypothetical protein
MSAILTFALLVLAASFGSWALSQWLASPRRLTERSFLLGVAGVACQIAAVGLGVYALAQSWPLLIPKYVAPARQLPPVAPEAVMTAPQPAVAMPTLPEVEPEASASRDEPPPVVVDARIAALKLAAQRAFHDHDFPRAAQLGEELLALLGDDADVRVLTANAYFMAERYEDAERHIEAAIGARLDKDGNPPLQWLRFQWSSAERLTNRFERARVQHALLQNYPEHRNEFSSAVDRRVVVSPHDTPPISELKPPRFSVPGPLLSEWATTECVAATRDTAGVRRLLLDNECARAVALVFASCPYSTPGCNASALVSSGWKYETQGVVLITAEQRPLMDRVAEGGPLIAPIYAVDAPEGRRIRYLACPLTDPEALTMLRDPELAGGDRATRLRAALARDACYARVLELSRAGRESGLSPDALLAGRA